MVLLALGASDCEALRDGWLQQPVNTLSSLAYVAAGAYVLRRDASRTPALGVALVGVGVGSVLYHGPMPRGAELVHDGSILALAAAVGLAWWRHSFRRPPTVALAAGGAAIVANVLTRTDAVLCRPASLLQGHATWHVLTAAAIAVWFSSRDEARDAVGRGRSASRFPQASQLSGGIGDSSDRPPVAAALEGDEPGAEPAGHALADAGSDVGVIDACEHDCRPVEPVHGGSPLRADLDGRAAQARDGVLRGVVDERRLGDAE